MATNLIGWLSRDGKHIPCEPYQHDIIARAYGASEITWELMGYVKIFNGGEWYCDRFITDAQEKWLIDNGLEAERER